MSASRAVWQRAGQKGRAGGFRKNMRPSPSALASEMIPSFTNERAHGRGASAQQYPLRRHRAESFRGMSRPMVAADGRRRAVFQSAIRNRQSAIGSARAHTRRDCKVVPRFSVQNRATRTARADAGFARELFVGRHGTLKRGTTLPCGAQPLDCGGSAPLSAPWREARADARTAVKRQQACRCVLVNRGQFLHSR